MDADRYPAFWPKFGETCLYSGRPESDKFVVVDIIKERPCNRYLIRSRNTGETFKAFRHQLFREEKLVFPAASSLTTSCSTPSYVDDSDPGFIPEDIAKHLLDFAEEFELEEVGLSNLDKDSDLDEEQLDEIDEGIKRKGTKLSENWAMNRFNDWQSRRNLNIDLHEVTPTQLAVHLRKFYAEVRSIKQEYLAPGSMRGIRAGIHRTLTGLPYKRSINIMDDKEFTQANKMLENMCKLYVAKPTTKKPKHYPAIEEGDMAKLALYLMKYEQSPDNALHTFWFLLCYLFARRGREGFREMNKSTFEIKTDDMGLEYLVMTSNEITKNWQGSSSSKAWDYSDVRAYGLVINENAKLNIVDVYRFYKSKLNPENDALFQKPKCVDWKNCSSWYHNTVIGKNKLGDLMKVISEKASLSKPYTNHSVRATSISIMYQGGVDTKHICKITKHKNEESLKHYIDGQTSAQKRQCCKVLSNGLNCSTLSNSSENLDSSETCPVQSPMVCGANLSKGNVPPVSSLETPLPIQGKPSKLISSPSFSGQPESSFNEQSSIDPVSLAGQGKENISPASEAPVVVNVPNNQYSNCTSNSQHFRMPFVGPQNFNFNVAGGNCHFHFHYDSQNGLGN